MRGAIQILIAVTLLASCSVARELAEPEIRVDIQSLNTTPISEATPSKTPTPDQPHPLTIEYLRSQEYNARNLVIEERLDDGPNYFRYIASYYSEGLKQYGLLTVPFGEAPESGWPVIIFNHGYIPPDVYRTTERYVAYMDSFARSGYIVYRPDYRGHDQSEGTARGAYLSPDYVIDVLNATAALKAYSDSDPDRIGMWGHSMGGYITLRAMLVDPDIKAGVIWAGVVGTYEQMYTLDDPPRYGSRFVAQFYGEPTDNQEFWAAISANSYLDELSGPLQLHHGTADQSVLPSFSIVLAEEAEAAGQTADLYLYEGDDHNLSNYFTAAMLRSIDFFNQHVKGE